MGLQSAAWFDYKQRNTIEFLVLVFSNSKKTPIHSNIMADKGLNLFDEWSTECEHLSPHEEECSSSSWGDSKMYKTDTIVNSYGMPTEINKNSAITKVRRLVEQLIL